MATQEAEYSLEIVVRATTCTSVFGLPALVSGFLFVPIWGMRTSHIILCCFGDKDVRWWATYRESSALPSSPLQLGSFVTGVWLRYKAHPPNKGCVIRDKTMCLTDEYVLNSEVCLTSELYCISTNVHVRKLYDFLAKRPFQLIYVIFYYIHAFWSFMY